MILGIKSSKRWEGIWLFLNRIRNTSSTMTQGKVRDVVIDTSNLLELGMRWGERYYGVCFLREVWGEISGEWKRSEEWGKDVKQISLRVEKWLRYRNILEMSHIVRCSFKIHNHTFDMCSVSRQVCVILQKWSVVQIQVQSTWIGSPCKTRRNSNYKDWKGKRS